MSKKLSTWWSFEGEAEFLSNFYPSPIKSEKLTFPTVEHAYQAAKFKDPKIHTRISKAKTPGQAKKMGRRIKDIRPDWNQIRLGVMQHLLWVKFSTHLDLRKELLETGDITLVEGNHWHDNYWGHCHCPGCHPKIHWNWMGRILMLLRSDLQTPRSKPSPRRAPRRIRIL